MRSSQKEQKPEYHVPHEHHGQSPMLSRKLRHSKRKTFSYSSLIKLGLLIFGTLFIGLFVLEMVKSQNLPTLSVVEKQSPPPPPETVQAAVPAVNEESQAAEPAVNEESQTALPAGTKQSPTAAAASGNNTSKTSTASSQTTVKTEPKKQTIPTKTNAAAPVSQPAANVEPKKAEPAEQPKAIRHVVKQGDTLFKLSRHYYGNGRGVEAIARYNGLQVDGELWVGTVLYIPMPKQ